MAKSITLNEDRDTDREQMPPPPNVTTPKETKESNGITNNQVEAAGGEDHAPGTRGNEPNEKVTAPPKVDEGKTNYQGEGQQEEKDEAEKPSSQSGSDQDNQEQKEEERKMNEGHPRLVITGFPKGVDPNSFVPKYELPMNGNGVNTTKRVLIDIILLSNYYITEEERVMDNPFSEVYYIGEGDETEMWLIGLQSNDMWSAGHVLYEHRHHIFHNMDCSQLNMRLVETGWAFYPTTEDEAAMIAQARERGDLESTDSSEESEGGYTFSEDGNVMYNSKGEVRARVPSEYTHGVIQTMIATNEKAERLQRIADATLPTKKVVEVIDLNVEDSDTTDDLNKKPASKPATAKTPKSDTSQVQTEESGVLNDDMDRKPSAIPSQAEEQENDLIR